MIIVEPENFWPTILENPSQFNQIKTGNKAFDSQSAAIYTVFLNTLISSDNEDMVNEMVTHWEITLDLNPDENKTLNERKATILYEITVNPPLIVGLIQRELELTLGEGKIIVENVPEENKVVVHTDRLDDEQYEVVTQVLNRVLPKGLTFERYNHTFEITWREINKYAECMTLDDMIAVNPNYQDDLTSEGEWVYPLPMMENMDCSSSEYAGWRNHSGIKKWSVDLPNVTNVKCLFKGATLEHFEGDMPNIKGGYHWQVFSQWGRKEFKTFKGNLGSLIDGMGFFWTGDAMTTFDSALPSLKKGELMFTRAILNKQSALNVLNTIPKWKDGETHPLTIGIDASLEFDEDIVAAITLADKKLTPVEDGGKGWTLQVQWNTLNKKGENVTYGLRKPIYAKVTEIDGERYLSWGHYVTDPENYKEFPSLEAAYEYFGLSEE